MHQAEIYNVYLLKLVVMDFGTWSISACTNSKLAGTIKNNRNYAKIGKVPAVSISTFALKCSAKILQQHLYICSIPVPLSSHFQSVRKTALWHLLLRDAKLVFSSSVFFQIKIS